MRAVAAVLAGIILIGTTVAGFAMGTPSIALFGLVVVAGGVSLYASATRQRWSYLFAIAHVASIIASVGWAFVTGEWVWGAVAAVAGGALWFAARTMRRYLRPGAEMPADVITRIENLAMLSGEAVSGIRIGARKSDGAVLGFGYCSIGQQSVRESRAVSKFLADAKNANDILQRSGGVSATNLCIVDRAGVNETIEDCRIVSVENIAGAISGAGGPNLETIVAAAEAAGITLSRQQLRDVGRRQGSTPGGKNAPKNGKKIVHKGRVTKVEQ